MSKRYFWFLPLALAFAMGCRTNESPKAQIDDLKITAQVRSKLVSDVGLASMADISINSTNGVVTLSGQVDSAEARQKAEVVAKTVPNVVQVIDNLQVAVRPVPTLPPGSGTE